MVIEINKDIDRYQESVAFGLSAKQLVFSVASIAIGGGLVYLLYPYIGLTGAAYVAIPVVAPIALGGFYTYNGMDFYEVMRRKFYFLFSNRVLTYVSTEGEQAIRQYEMQKSIEEKKNKKTESKVHEKDGVEREELAVAKEDDTCDKRTRQRKQGKAAKGILRLILGVILRAIIFFWVIVGIIFAYDLGYFDFILRIFE